VTGQVEREVMGTMLTANADAAAAVLSRPGGSSDGSVLAAIAATRSLSLIVEDTLKALVGQARAEGHTWAQIGQILRVSRQAAFQRFGSEVVADRREEAEPALADAEQRTVSLVADLLAGRWQVVEETFTPRMIEILPRELLESTRARISQAWGDLAQTGPAVVTVQDGLTVVDLPLCFERANASCRAVFNSEGKVGGMLWRPAAVPGQ
jgi:hypothetical protein